MCLCVCMYSMICVCPGYNFGWNEIDSSVGAPRFAKGVAFLIREATTPRRVWGQVGQLPTLLYLVNVLLKRKKWNH